MITTASMLASDERLKLVSSLYGPGAVGCWLSMVCSVFVTWLFNEKTRRKDNLTNDLMATLTLPLVAAGHLIYQLATYTGDRSTILTTTDPVLLPRVAAIEAPLTICEFFAALALSLFALSAWKFQLKRCLVVGVTGLICFGVESSLFITSPTSTIRRSNFSRPFLLNEQIAMVPLMMFIAGLAVVTILSWLRFYAAWRRQNCTQSAAAPIEIDAPEAIVLQHSATGIGQPHESIHAVIERASEDQSLRKRDVENASASMKRLTLVTTLFVPLSFAASFGIPLGAFGVTSLGRFHNFTWRLRFFIPETTCSITDLDQSVALGGGLASLAFSLFEAIKIRRTGE